MSELFNRTGYTLYALVTVGIAGFLLGGLSVYSLCGGREPGPVRLTPLSASVPFSDRRVYASLRGKRYYPWWCDAGRSISPDNLVWYDTPEDAVAGGYSVAKSCE